MTHTSDNVFPSSERFETNVFSSLWRNIEKQIPLDGKMLQDQLLQHMSKVSEVFESLDPKFLAALAVPPGLTNSLRPQQKKKLLQAIKVFAITNYTAKLQKRLQEYFRTVFADKELLIDCTNVGGIFLNSFAGTVSDLLALVGFTFAVMGKRVEFNGRAVKSVNIDD